MKRKKNKELNVDSIGEQKPLTKKEEKSIAEYFQRNKSRKIRLRTKRKTTA